MKFFKNLWAIFVVLNSLISAGKAGKEIDHARIEGNIPEEKKCIRTATSGWASKIVNAFDMHIHISGEENIPADGPVVFIANHQSYLDIVVFLFVMKKLQIGFIAKNALAKVPLLGRWIRRIRGIFINREDPKSSLQTINEGVDLLKNGFSLVIFPEGTRSRSAKMNKFKAGSFKLATKAKAVIVPITLDGTYKVYENSGMVTKGIDITFDIHPQIPTADFKRQDILALPQMVEDVISGDLQQQNEDVCE